MKTSLNKHKRSAAGLLIAVAAFAAALTGCQKDFEMDLPLAVAARELSLSKEAGWSIRTESRRHASRAT